MSSTIARSLIILVLLGMLPAAEAFASLIVNAPVDVIGNLPLAAWTWTGGGAQINTQASSGRADSFLLAAASPVLSVYPSRSTDTAGYAFRVSTVGRDSGTEILMPPVSWSSASLAGREQGCVGPSSNPLPSAADWHEEARLEDNGPSTRAPPTVFLVVDGSRNPREGMADETSDRGQKKGGSPLSVPYRGRQRPPPVRDRHREGSGPGGQGDRDRNRRQHALHAGRDRCRAWSEAAGRPQARGQDKGAGP